MVHIGSRLIQLDQGPAILPRMALTLRMLNFERFSPFTTIPLQFVEDVMSLQLDSTLGAPSQPQI